MKKIIDKRNMCYHLDQGQVCLENIIDKVQVFSEKLCLELEDCLAHSVDELLQIHFLVCNNRYD